MHLKTANGTVIVRSQTATLAAGSRAVQVGFETSALVAANQNGPYQIAMVELVALEPAGAVPNDRRINLGQTAAYMLTNFQRPPIIVTGVVSDRGVDTNGNGRFDRLEVVVALDVLRAGSYSWTAKLTDLSRIEVAFASGSANLSAGQNTVTLVFPGVAIGASGKAGPYLVRDMLISGTASLVDTEVGSTASYQASQFEGFTGPPAGSASRMIVRNAAPPNSEITSGVRFELTTAVPRGSQVVRLSAAGGDIDSVVASVTSGPTFWLSAAGPGQSPSGGVFRIGQAPADCGGACGADVVLSVNAAGLAPGTYNGSVTFGPSDGPVSPVTVNVILTVANLGLPRHFGVFRPLGAFGQWALDADGSRSFTFGVDPFYSFGLAGDQAVTGDWTGTGVTRLGVFRNGQWYLDLNNNGRWDSEDGMYSFGLPGDIAVPGDWDGSGIAKFGIYRNGLWALDWNGNKRFDAGDRFHSYGLAGDRPVVKNWSGTGRADQLGVFRNGVWYVDSNGDGAYQVSDAQYSFGVAGDQPVVGDWSNTGQRRIGIFRGGTWVLDTNGNNAYDASDAVAAFGLSTDQAVTGVWTIR